MSVAGGDQSPNYQSKKGSVAKDNIFRAFGIFFEEAKIYKTKINKPFLEQKSAKLVTESGIEIMVFLDQAV